MKPIITILFLFIVSTLGQTTSTKTVIAEVKASLKNCKVVYFTKTEKRGNIWVEFVERLFIKKGSKFTKKVKERLKGAGDIYVDSFIPGAVTKERKSILFLRSTSAKGKTRGMGISDEVYLRLLQEFKFEERQQPPN